METGGDDEQKICRRKNGRSWNCKNVSGDNILQYCEKHYNDYLDPTKKMEDEKLPPDEERCSQASNGGWRCKSFRMGHADDDTVPKSRYCEKHYRYQSTEYKKKMRFKKKTSGDHGEGTAEEIRGSKRRRKKVDDGTETQKLGAAIDDTLDTIIEVGTGNIRRKTRIKGSREPESSTRTREPLVEFESMENYKSKCFELSVELENNKVQLEKKKIECTRLQRELAEVVQTRKTASTEVTEGTQYWRKMFFDLESRFLRTQNSEERVECPTSKLGSLVLRSGKENSVLRCVDLGDSVKIEPEAWGLQNDVTQSVEKQIDETSCGGGEYSHGYELKTKEEVLNKYENIEEGKGWGCSEERPSQDHLEMSNKPFANLVSDDNSCESLGESEDSDSSADSETSLGGLLDRLEMKYRNRKENQELKSMCSGRKDLLAQAKQKETAAQETSLSPVLQRMKILTPVF